MLVKINLELIKSAGLTPADFVFLTELYDGSNVFTENYDYTNLLNTGWVYIDNDNICLTSKYVNTFKDTDNMFYQFYDTFPVQDETGRIMRHSRESAKRFYHQIVNNDINLHQHILTCLRFDIERRTRRGDVRYMLGMEKYIKSRAWEEIEQVIKEEQKLKMKSKNLW
jgi:hypothetical protein